MIYEFMAHEISVSWPGGRPVGAGGFQSLADVYGAAVMAGGPALVASHSLSTSEQVAVDLVVGGDLELGVARNIDGEVSLEALHGAGVGLGALVSSVSGTEKSEDAEEFHLD